MRSLLTCCLLVPRAGMRRVATCRILCDFLLVCIFFNSFSFPFFLSFSLFSFRLQLSTFGFAFFMAFAFQLFATCNWSSRPCCWCCWCIQGCPTAATATIVSSLHIQFSLVLVQLRFSCTGLVMNISIWLRMGKKC